MFAPVLPGKPLPIHTSSRISVLDAYYALVQPGKVRGESIRQGRRFVACLRGEALKLRDVASLPGHHQPKLFGALSRNAYFADALFEMMYQAKQTVQSYHLGCRLKLELRPGGLGKIASESNVLPCDPDQNAGDSQRQDRSCGLNGPRVFVQEPQYRCHAITIYLFHFWPYNVNSAEPPRKRDAARAAV